MQHVRGFYALNVFVVLVGNRCLLTLDVVVEQPPLPAGFAPLALRTVEPYEIGSSVNLDQQLWSWMRPAAHDDGHGVVYLLYTEQG